MAVTLFTENNPSLFIFLPDSYRKFMKYLQNQFGEQKSQVPLKLKTVSYTDPLGLRPSIAMQMASPFCTGTKSIFSLSPTKSADLPPPLFLPPFSAFQMLIAFLTKLKA